MNSNRSLLSLYSRVNVADVIVKLEESKPIRKETMQSWQNKIEFVC